MDIKGAGNSYIPDYYNSTIKKNEDTFFANVILKELQQNLEPETDVAATEQIKKTRTYIPASERVYAQKVPYGFLAKDNMIHCNDAVFICDEKTNSICLGDMSNKDNVINIHLSGGGNLKVNRDNLDQLASAIGMFTPEDVNLIMRAITKDTKIQSMKNEIEEDKNSIGNSAQQHVNNGGAVKKEEE